ncbi:MAG: class I SAM-dependent methyltransferase [Chloroflexota bacterium]|nr:class I SAM-dependent methyltransferase [Dehalococcoidia bacterium]MDW8254528.1 class I SAM-dependent methyltransferase [Chloroflexota bacterium]
MAAAVIPALLGWPTGGLKILSVDDGAAHAWLRRFAGRRPVISIAAAPAAIRRARRSGSRAALASLEALPFRSERFDLIYGAARIQHLSDERRARLVAEFWRVLRPGGAILWVGSAAPGSFDWHRFSTELEAAGLTPVVVGAVGVLPAIIGRWSESGGARGSKEGFPHPFRKWGRLGRLALAIGGAAEAAAFRVRGQLPTRGALSLVGALKVVPFERA